MVDSSSYVAWARLITELDDAQEHLKSLINEMTAKGALEEAELQSSLGHIYAHLNRAWNSRNNTFEITENQWREFSQFPTNIDPVG